MSHEDNPPQPISMEQYLTERYVAQLIESNRLAEDATQHLGWIASAYSPQLKFDFTGTDLHPDQRRQEW